MKKIFKKLKNRAGLTLTEMLVTLGILSIFSAACLTGMTTALSVRRDNITANDAEIIASMVTNYIANELRTASSIDLVDLAKEDDTVNEAEASEITYQSNESGYKSVTLKADNILNILQLTINSKKANTGEDDPKDVKVFSEAAYSDKDVNKGLKISDLKFKFTKSDNTITVSFNIVPENGGSNIPIADTKFTVGLMNYKTD